MCVFICYYVYRKIFVLPIVVSRCIMRKTDTQTERTKQAHKKLLFKHPWAENGKWKKCELYNKNVFICFVVYSYTSGIKERMKERRTIERKKNSTTQLKRVSFVVVTVPLSSQFYCSFGTQKLRVYAYADAVSWVGVAEWEWSEMLKGKLCFFFFHFLMCMALRYEVDCCYLVVYVKK